MHHALSANVKPKAAPEAAYPLISQRLARPGRTGQATRQVRRQPHSFEAPEAAPGGGASCGGAAAAAAGRLGAAAGFLATAAAGATDEVGRGDSSEALAADDGALLAEGGTARCADGAAPAPGSGVMMLTGGVDAAVGNSALVGRPVGIDGDSIATGALAGDAFHNGA